MATRVAQWAPEEAVAVPSAAPMGEAPGASWMTTAGSASEPVRLVEPAVLREPAVLGLAGRRVRQPLHPLRHHR